LSKDKFGNALFSKMRQRGAGDTYGRLLARLMSKYIPGHPTFVAQNMPGAGGIQAANYTYTIAPQDGTVMVASRRPIAQASLTGVPGTRYDSRKFHWIGSLNNEVGVCVNYADHPVKRFEDLFEKELIVAATANADSDHYPQVLKNVLGAKLKIVTGYPSGASVLLAMERHEADGRCGWSWSSVVVQKPGWTDGKLINVLVQLAVEKHPDLPHVPLVTDFARNDGELMLLRFVFASGVMGRPFMVGPRVPADRVAALRKAFDDMVKDEEVIAEFRSKKQELTPIAGNVLQKLVDELYATPPALIARVANAAKQ